MSHLLFFLPVEVKKRKTKRRFRHHRYAIEAKKDFAEEKLT
jgi:hypothetical protein